MNPTGDRDDLDLVELLLDAVREATDGVVDIDLPELKERRLVRALVADPSLIFEMSKPR